MLERKPQEGSASYALVQPQHLYSACDTGGGRRTQVPT